MEGDLNHSYKLLETNMYTVVVGLVVSIRLRYSSLTRSKRKQSSNEVERQKERINAEEYKMAEGTACTKPKSQHQASLKCFMVRLPREQLNVHNKGMIFFSQN